MFSQAILVTMIMLLAIETNTASVPMETCQTSCGNLSIPFPFGTSPDCSLDDSFLITCNHSHNPPKTFLYPGSIQVLDISLDGLMKVASSVASDCYDHSGSQIKASISELTLSNFAISSSRNKFMAVGCDTYALVEGAEGWKQMSAGCVSWCDSVDRVVNGTCSGIGCCQTSIPKGVKDFLVEIQSFRNHTKVNSFNPCGYAFVVETDAFEFSSSDLKDLSNRKNVPVVLDWSVGNVTCQEASRNDSSSACRATQSECIDLSSGTGYNCKCLTGFQGNPYLVKGCQDINECITLQPCVATCTNLPGSYSCSCPKGFEGDGKKDGSGCHRNNQISGSTLFYIASGLMVPVAGSSWIFWRRKQKKVGRLRRNLFLRNGGELLAGIFAIFTAEDLKKATNNYSENNTLSLGGRYGTNYKGMLPDGRLVTVTKFDALDKCGVDLFIRKLISLSQFPHRNVVQLLGCCLETQVPLLVHEFFEYETLYDYIHDDGRASYLSWDIRLRIAEETAHVLLHLHSGVLAGMIHGKLSSSSILLHHGYDIKVHDYDSRFLDDDILPSYAGTIGYLDPECWLTDCFTVESDVYGFGVVLAEILTGKKVFSCDRPEGEELLAQYFVNSRDNLIRILDHRLVTDGKIEMLTEVAKIAERCLSHSSADRPTMTEVVTALEKARSMDSSSTTITLNSSQGTAARRFVRRNRSF